MKKTLLFAVFHFIAALVLLQGCQDDDDKQDELSILSVTPEEPYEDEEVTLTGTGFGTDPAGIQVILMTSGGADATCVITQIDNTIIKVKLPDNVNFGVGYYGKWKIIKGPNQYIHPTNTTFKKALKIIEVNNISEGTSRIRPDNIIEVVSRGGEKVFITCSVAGVEKKPVQQVTVTENFYTSFKFILPRDFYVSDNFVDTATAWVDVIVSEGAREVSRRYKTRLMPETGVQTLGVTAESYSITQLLNQGGVLDIHITGRNLYSRCVTKFRNVSQNVFIGGDVLGTVNGNVFFDEIHKGVPVTNFTSGDYVMSLYNADEKWMGDFSFTLTN